MIETVIGGFLIVGAAVTVIPGVIDRFYERFKPWFRVLSTEWSYNWSRRLARVWVPPFLLLLGVVFVLDGVGLLG